MKFDVIIQSSLVLQMKGFYEENQVIIYFPLDYAVNNRIQVIDEKKSIEKLMELCEFDGTFLYNKTYSITEKAGMFKAEFRVGKLLNREKTKLMLQHMATARH